MAQRYSALAQGKSGKGADADGKNHNHIHPEALHLAKRPTAGASGDNPRDSAPAVDSERCQTLCYLGVAPPLVLSADWLLEHDTWATRLFRFPLHRSGRCGVGVLARTGHILVYAPGDSLRCRLATARTILGDPCLFLAVAALASSLAPVTYGCMLPATRCVAALPPTNITI